MTKLNFEEGAFRIEACENGHLTLSVVDGDERVKFVAVLSEDEALSLASRLKLVVAELAMHRRAARFRRAAGRRLPEVH